MRKIVCNLAFLLMFSAHWSAWALEEYSEAQKLTIDSQVMDEQRNLVVYLPAGYQNSEERFPVLYVTDGDIQGPHTAGTLDYLAKFDQIPNMIVVGIVNPRDTRNRDLALAAKDKQKGQQLEGADHFLTFIEQEVIPLIKARYRTFDYQALSGTSHGGQFAINALIKRPGLFNGVIAISPTLYWNENQLLELSEVAMKNQQLQGRLYISIANEEAVMTDPFQKMVELTKRYPSSKLIVTSQTFNQESHNTTVLLGQYYGLKHLFSDWAIPEVPQTLADLQANYERRSQLFNTIMIIPEDRANGYGQWLQHLNRQQDALALLEWNQQTYPQSLSANQELIKAYLRFDLVDKAKAALDEALKTLKELDFEQKQALESLFS